MSKILTKTHFYYKTILLLSYNILVISLAAPIKDTSLNSNEKTINQIEFDNLTFIDDIKNKAERFKYLVVGASIRYIVQNDYAKYFNKHFHQQDSDNFGHECLLGTPDIYLPWLDPFGRIVNYNRTNEYLDLSNSDINDTVVWSDFVAEFSNETQILSLANNNLKALPLVLLQRYSSSLVRLSLMGNNLQWIGVSSKEPNTVNRIFPKMAKLKTLDLRYCQLEFIGNESFVNLNRLEKLIISFNKIRKIESMAFSQNNILRHLDLAYNFNPLQKDDDKTNRMDPYISFVDGLCLQHDLFQRLSNLSLLDLSHSKLHAFSGISLFNLGQRLEQLSLCYTQIPIIPDEMFIDTNLKVLDLSGNQGLVVTFGNKTLKGLENKLEILAFENAYLKHIDWISELTKLKILKLWKNNINSIPINAFNNLTNLKIIDLSSNHLGHWYQRIIFNHQVEVLDLRENNINVISNEMIADFRHVNYLALARNNFICNCMLREFLEMSGQNVADLYCKDGKDQPKTRSRSLIENKELIAYDAYRRILNKYLTEYKKHQSGILNHHENFSNKRKFKIFDSKQNKVDDLRNIQSKKVAVYCNQTKKIATMDSPTRPYTSQLLDYIDDHYKCMNSDTNKEYFIAELEQCGENVTPFMVNDDLPTDVLILYPLLAVLTLAILILFIYYRGYDIKYFCLTFRNVTVLSLMDKDKRKLLKNRKSSDYNEYAYDVFVSYSEQNRDWVLDHLLPNIEERDGINVCLHERDFKVGLSILENIISCIDQSKTILLVISQSFVASNWCQFELHLAQHRLLETRREQLILVLLEEIPRISRPRTLQYLMRTKTYIEWPTEKRKTNGNKKIQHSVNIEQQRKVFWKRLKNAIIEKG